MPEIESVEEIPLFLGGPVGTQMMFYMHTLGPEVVPEAIEVGDGVWFGGDFDAIKRYVELGAPVEGRIKFIVGYSGWEKDQIASELQRHDWAVLDNCGREHASATVTVCGSTCPATRATINSKTIHQTKNDNEYNHRHRRRHQFYQDTRYREREAHHDTHVHLV